MRVNVYGDELTDEVELVEEEVDDQVRYGLRILLDSSDRLAVGGRHSAVTLWLPNDAEGNPHWALGKDLLSNLGTTMHEAWMRFNKLRGPLSPPEGAVLEPVSEPDVQGRDIAGN